jgi:hypothetical protein
MELQYSNQLQEIIQIYKDGSTDPMDGDETERFSKILLFEMDLLEGNITPEEYDVFINSLF